MIKNRIQFQKKIRLFNNKKLQATLLSLQIQSNFRQYLLRLLMLLLLRHLKLRQLALKHSNQKLFNLR